MEEIAGAAGGAARALVFIGFMGAGKSTAARQVADEQGLRALDSDSEIERREGARIAEIFAKQGEGRFREIEQQVVLELLEGAGGDAAVSLGGGSVLSPEVQQALRAHVVVLLDVDMETAWSRAGAEDGSRPLALDKQRFESLYEQRAPLYRRLADAILPAGRRGVAIEASAALAALRAAPKGTKLLWASSASGSYPVLVGGGLIAAGILAETEGTPAALWPLDRRRSRAFCVTDENVDRLYADRLGDLVGKLAIPPGETHKTASTAQRVWEALIEAGLTRADHLIALGGGVVGDLAGFCAATYQRGIRYIQVPTTLVAQVDSAYGGKTGVDLQQGKNYVGAYHQPSGVIVDPRTLSSLPDRELAAGWVEVAKTALIAGGELWERVSADEPLDERMILLCAEAKTAIVSRDERDSGARQALNLGHTIGHAIETATSYRRYLHGEAVGLGLLAALRLSGAEQLRSQIEQLMIARGLPTALEDATAQDVIAATRRDKKRLRGEVPFVLLASPGDVEIGCEVSQRELAAAVAELTGESCP